MGWHLLKDFFYVFEICSQSLMGAYFTGRLFQWVLIFVVLLLIIAFSEKNFENTSLVTFIFHQTPDSNDANLQTAWFILAHVINITV